VNATTRVIHYADFGSDVHGDGSMERPFQTPRRAAAHMGAGDAICDMGVYAHTAAAGIRWPGVAVIAGLSAAGWVALYGYVKLWQHNPTGAAFITGCAVIIGAAIFCGPKKVQR
jgi:hypothetical protein